MRPSQNNYLTSPDSVHFFFLHPVLLWLFVRQEEHKPLSLLFTPSKHLQNKIMSDAGKKGGGEKELTLNLIAPLFPFCESPTQAPSLHLSLLVTVTETDWEREPKA